MDHMTCATGFDEDGLSQAVMIQAEQNTAALSKTQLGKKHAKMRGQHTGLPLSLLLARHSLTQMRCINMEEAPSPNSR